MFSSSYSPSSLTSIWLTFVLNKKTNKNIPTKTKNAKLETKKIAPNNGNPTEILQNNIIFKILTYYRRMTNSSFNK